MCSKTILLGAALAASLSTSAFAGRGIQIDVSANPANVCAISDDSCLPSLGVTEGPYVGPLSTVYVYSEGVISFGAPLGQSQAIFSIAQSDTTAVEYDAYVGYTNAPGYYIDLIDFFRKGTTINPGITRPDFQISLNNVSANAVQVGYALASAPADATIGYNVNGNVQSVTNSDGLRFGEGDADSTFVFLLSQDNSGGVNLDSAIFDAKYDAAPPVTEVPEPASWVMLVLGFGVVGRMLRARRKDLAIA